MPSKLSLLRQRPWNLVWFKQVFKLSEVALTEFHCTNPRVATPPVYRRFLSENPTCIFWMGYQWAGVGPHLFQSPQCAFLYLDSSEVCLHKHSEVIVHKHMWLKKLHDAQYPSIQQQMVVVSECAERQLSSSNQNWTQHCCLPVLT